MKLFFAKWKKAVCLSMVTVLILLGMKAAYYDFEQNTPKLCYAAGSGIASGAAKASREYDEVILYACSLRVTCSTESMRLEGEFDAKTKPAGAEIYRAKVKSNGKNGKFKKIGSCKDFIKQEYSYDPNVWAFHYEDNTVKTGKAYAYKYKVYCETEGETYQYQECYSYVIRGMAAKTVGKYTCTVVKNTAKKLVVKLTGKSKKNGLLESLHSPLRICGMELKYKNDGENEIHRYLNFVKFSYDGKKWDYTGKFAIQGKQSVYLYFEEYLGGNPPTNGIKFSGYQYAQMFFFNVSYNLQCGTRFYDKYEGQQIRFNLSSGTAAASNFKSHKYGQLAFVWDEDIFTRDYEEDMF